MDTGYDSGRWWENYLVRYFMPSIAGVGIVSWMFSIEPRLKPLLFFGSQSASLDAPTLTLLILYGNLFCYIASFPILCFHTTRVLDFSKHKWAPRWNDGYVVSLIVTALITADMLFAPRCIALLAVFLITIAYDIIQIGRFMSAMSQISLTLKSEGPASVSSAYAYAHHIAKRRTVEFNIPFKDDNSHDISSARKDKQKSTSPNKSYEIVKMRWRKEFTDTYRHMREHGNSAFIFVLELTLATACYGIIRTWPTNGISTISYLGALLACWTAPSVCVHLYAQSLERRFSRHDEKLENANGPKTS